MSPVHEGPTRIAPAGRLVRGLHLRPPLHHGVDACEQGVSIASVIDKPVFELLPDGGASTSSTEPPGDRCPGRAQARGSTARCAIPGRGARWQGAGAALERVEGDYLAGRITAEQWGRLEDRLRGELAAAEAEVDQYEQRDLTVTATVDAFEADAAPAGRTAGDRRDSGWPARSPKAAIWSHYRPGSQAAVRGLRVVLAREAVRQRRPGRQGVIWTPKAEDDPTVLGEGLLAPCRWVRALGARPRCRVVRERVSIAHAGGPCRSATTSIPSWSPGSRPAPAPSRRRRASGATGRAPGAASTP